MIICLECKVTVSKVSSAVKKYSRVKNKKYSTTQQKWSGHEGWSGKSWKSKSAEKELLLSGCTWSFFSFFLPAGCWLISGRKWTNPASALVSNYAQKLESHRKRITAGAFSDWCDARGSNDGSPLTQFSFSFYNLDAFSVLTCVTATSSLRPR